MMYFFLFLFLIFSSIEYKLLANIFLFISIIVTMMRIIAFNSFVKLTRENTIELKHTMENENYIILRGFFSIYRENTNIYLFFVELILIFLFYILTFDYSSLITYFMIKIIYDLSFIDFRKIFEEYIENNYNYHELQRILKS